MFQPTGLFGQVPCPIGDKCELINCIFDHSPLRARSEVSAKSNRISPSPTKKTQATESVDEPLKKKVKVSTSTESNIEIRAAGTATARSVGASVSRRQPQKPQPSASTSLKSIHRRISPPPARSEASKAGTQAVSSKSTNAMPESLNPRKVPVAPANHALRTRLLRLLFEQMQRLNNEFKSTPHSKESTLLLSPYELHKMALDEEERMAKSNVSIYSNVVKLRITTLKKMDLDAWMKERHDQISKHRSKGSRDQWQSKKAKTGLTQQEEHTMLLKLISSQEGLEKHGYVTAQIEDGEIEKAREGVESAHGYESCDRCGSRFQVFPGRREDGTLTTGGTCTYHFGRLRRKGTTTNADQHWTCCQDAPGSTGCETAEHHVFKVTDPKRLALILPFEQMAADGPRIPTKGVCFDCEMGYTTLGMELIRLTAIDWYSSKELLDVLVRPLGEILDLNSRFSGVWPEEFASAPPYEGSQASSEVTEKKLCIVNSPSVARQLLLRHLTTTTPLIGHALENDLNAARIIHPTIIDTVLLFPHPRGLPYRNGLKILTKQQLDIDIQMAGAQGHDSKEDARAAGELVRFEIGRKWRWMSLNGWKVADGEFIPPPESRD